MDFDQLVAMGLPSARGRRAADVRVTYVRDIGPHDVDFLLAPPEKGVQSRPIAKLRNTHHMLAKLLADGRSNSEASLITGYSPSRVSVLRSDPAFQELMAYYAGQAEAKYLDVHERLAALGMASLDELQERLESDPDSFRNKELMELAEFALDRSVTKEARKGLNPNAVPPAVQINFVGAAALPPVAPEDFSKPVIDLDFKDVP